MKSEKLGEIIKYLDDNDLEITDIDLGDDEICDIKANSILLSDIYIKFFDEFYRVFKKCEIVEVKKYLDDEIYNKLRSLSSYKFNECKFARSSFEDELREYVDKNLTKIRGFVDFFIEVRE